MCGGGRRSEQNVYCHIAQNDHNIPVSDVSWIGMLLKINESVITYCAFRPKTAVG